MPLFSFVCRSRRMRNYEIIGDGPRGHSVLQRRKRHAADFIPTYGGLRDTPTYHDAETGVGEKGGKDFYRKRGLAHRLSVAQKRLLHRQAVLLSEHAPR